MNVSSGVGRPAVAGYAATTPLLNCQAWAVAKELAGEGITASLVVPSVTGTGFAGRRFPQPGPWPAGMVSHRPPCAGRLIPRTGRAGPAGIDIPQGAEQAESAQVAPS
jgi:hypothetical protein